jgi:opacity protein-like surface antigen
VQRYQPRRTYVQHYSTTRTYRYRPHHGVFVYGPRVEHHHHYRQQPNVTVVKEEHLPTRNVNRKNSWAFGVRSGSYLTAYDGSNPYGDFGLGLTARYRPFEAMGLEAAVMHHSQTWEAETERSQTIGQASVMVFANPWGRISPYALGGLTANMRTINDGFRVEDGSMNSLQTQDVLWGPHAGVGVEFAFGKNVALDLEARYTGYLNTERDDPSLPGALQTTAGFLVHF